MIDIHCHILPNVDDGPKSWDISQEMCRMAAEDGIEHIVATPHANERYKYDRQLLASELEYLKSLVGPAPKPEPGLRFPSLLRERAGCPDYAGTLHHRRQLTTCWSNSATTASRRKSTSTLPAWPTWVSRPSSRILSAIQFSRTRRTGFCNGWIRVAPCK